MEPEESNNNIRGCSCGDNMSEPHSCPFQCEINNNEDFQCTCCSECQHECLMDI